MAKSAYMNTIVKTSMHDQVACGPNFAFNVLLL